MEPKNTRKRAKRGAGTNTKDSSKGGAGTNSKDQRRGGPFGGMSVRPSVRPSVRHTFPGHSGSLPGHFLNPKVGRPL